MESYNTILERMLGDYKSLAGSSPSEESDIMLRLRVLAGEIYKLRVDADFIRRQLYPTTASGEYLDAHALTRGLTRRSARKAHGSVLFYRAEEYTDELFIPAGTQVCTYNDNKRFVTTEDTTLSAGAERVSVKVEAVQASASYNVRGGTITVLVTPIAGISKVYNGSVYTDGADEESDEELRQRVLDSYRYIANGTNAAYYKSLAMSVAGVYSAGVIGRARGNGTVDVYVCGENGEVNASILAQVQELLSQMRELNVDVRARHASEAEINLHIRLSVREGYAFSAVANTVKETVSNYIDALGVGGDVLLSDIGDIVFHTEGVAGYRFIESYGSNRAMTNAQRPVANSILISEGSSV